MRNQQLDEYSEKAVGGKKKILSEPRGIMHNADSKKERLERMLIELGYIQYMLSKSGRIKR